MRVETQRPSDACFIRNPVLPGVELRLVNGQRDWGFVSQSYQILFSLDWHGNAWHLRERFTMSPERIVVAGPGQLILTRKSRAGTIACLTLDPALIARFGEEWSTFRGGGNVPIPKGLQELLWGFAQSLPAAQFPEALDQTLAAIMREVSRLLPCARAHATEGPNTVGEFVVLDESVDAYFDLHTLSEHLGTSRFSALRAFKRHFGLPPHSYQIHLRVDQAQAGLRAGHSPARVAVDCGFFDQSHLTRHFKRVLGTTPAQYARAGTLVLAQAAR